MKSPAGKREVEGLHQQVRETRSTDFNFGTLIRTDATDEYTQFNTTFVTRLQFYVYEIARCRRGLNDWVYERPPEGSCKEKAKKAQSKSPFVFQHSLLPSDLHSQTYHVASA